MQKGRLLIFDDDPAVGKVLRVIAESNAFDAREVTGPADFFAAFSDWRPTHIALDLIMAGMDGVQVLAELARRGCTARIILTSGIGSVVLDATARSAGERGLSIAGVLAKPFLPAELRRLLQAAPDTLNSSGASRHP